MQNKKKSFPYERLFDLVNDGILILYQSKVVFCNTILTNWLGYSHAELIDTSIDAIIAPEDQSQIHQNKLRLIQKMDSVIQSSFSLIHKNNNSKISVLANMTLLDEGEWSGHCVLTLKNTSNETMIQKLLYSSQQNLQEIIETFPDIYYVTDTKGILTKVSPSVFAILGYEPYEVLGTPMIHYYEFPELRDQLMSKVVAAQGKYVKIEATLLHKSGRPIWFNTRARILINENNSIIGLEGLARDSTVEKTAQDLIEKNQKELLEIKNSLEIKVKIQTEELLQKERLWLQKSRHAQMGEMISAIAHQWRQPLNALTMWNNNISTLFFDNNLQSEDVKVFSEKTDTLIRSMSQTIDEFRGFFSPLTNADIFNLKDAINASLQLINPNLNQLKINFKHIQSENIWVSGYPNEFGQVIINLLTNSKESCLGNKTEHPEISIYLKIESENAILEIQDNAGGIPPDIIDKIFDPYFTTKNKGTGIGLYMSKNIIERHMNGHISVLNNQQGARFKIIFPLSKTIPDKSTIKNNENMPYSAQDSFRNISVNSQASNHNLTKLDQIRILFVDDNAEAREIFEVLMKKKGAIVCITKSATECIEQINIFKPDILISDILMPEEDGYSLIKKIRELEKKSGSFTPAIALSAHVDSEEIQHALNLGFQKYLTKPVDWKSLIKMIHELTSK